MAEARSNTVKASALCPENCPSFCLHPHRVTSRQKSTLGDAVSEWRDRLNIRKELRLYDARGTAATRLLEAGADLKEIATHMGWSLKHAAEVIERYVALSADMSDSLAEKLKTAEKRKNLQTKLQTGGQNEG